MKYFYNPDRVKTVAHLWTGTDTYCRMWSTGGLAGKKAKGNRVMGVLDNRTVCKMCKNNAPKAVEREPAPIVYTDTKAVLHMALETLMRLKPYVDVRHVPMIGITIKSIEATLKKNP